MASCTNSTKSPYQIPGYHGFVPGLASEVGFTYSQGTHEMMKSRGSGGAPFRPCAQTCGTMNPCEDHGKDLRARLHMLQGEIDPNPCSGTDSAVTKFCIPRPFKCEPKLKKNNQHGYLSRMSVYQNQKNPDEFGVTACKANNTFPCKAAAPSQRPFCREFEDLTNYDTFKDYSPECRHLPFPKLTYKHASCWDEDFFLPEDCYEDYRKHGYVCPPKICECLPLDSQKNDEDIKYYRREGDPASFNLPYFMDPSNKHRCFKSHYTGTVPSMRFRLGNGETFALQSRNALNVFTNRYLTTIIKQRCPVWVDPGQYCDKTDYYKAFCKPRRTYDGHFHEKPIRDRLRPIFEPKDCVDPYTNNPMPLCIQRN